MSKLLKKVVGSPSTPGTAKFSGSKQFTGLAPEGPARSPAAAGPDPGAAPGATTGSRPGALQVNVRNPKQKVRTLGGVKSVLG